MSHAFDSHVSLGDPLTLAERPAALPPAKAGMIAFLFSEASFFGTLIMAYVFFLKQTIASDPKPSEVFYLPLVFAASLCLFSSSATIHLAEKALRRDRRGAFLGWWGSTIVLGTLFLCGTMYEWNELIGRWGLTISRNLFGTTYFTLVGFHALHVSIGVIVMCIVFGLCLARKISATNHMAAEVVSWYWHFVDGVWLVVLTLVYVVGR